MTDSSNDIVQSSSERPVQYFKDEDIERGKKMTPTQIVQFLDDFANIMATARKVNQLG